MPCQFPSSLRTSSMICIWAVAVTSQKGCPYVARASASRPATERRQASQSSGMSSYR